MKKQLLFGAILLFTLSSCSSLHKIIARDTSTNVHNNTKKKKHDIKFINDIEIQPGDAVTAKHKTSGIKKKSTYHYTYDTSLANSVSLEDANPLQIKYAIITDAEVEKLNNISLLEKIDEWWGTKYCIGGQSKDCTDCSGFSGTIFKEVYNIELPRTAADQYNSCDKITTDSLQEGDLVFFHTYGRSISHVGIYITNNKFVHASTSEGVTISDLNDKYWQPRFMAAGRVKQ